MKKFYIRAASAFVFSVAMIGGTLWNSYSFLLLIGVILVGSLNEYFSLIAGKTQLRNFKWFIILLYTLIYLVAFSSLTNPCPERNWAGMFSISAFIIFGAALYSKSENPFADVGWKLVPFFWVLIPLILACKIYFERGGVFLLAVFGTIWVYDTGCYVVGSLIGKHKLFERVSPKKTWEGVAGGVVIAVVASLFVNRIPGLSMFSPVQWAVIVFVITVAATFGDLTESLLKRSLGVKDSGNLLPGHGGFLDRYDSLFFAVPFADLASRIIEMLAS